MSTPSEADLERAIASALPRATPEQSRHFVVVLQQILDLRDPLPSDSQRKEVFLKIASVASELDRLLGAHPPPSDGTSPNRLFSDYARFRRDLAYIAWINGLFARLTEPKRGKRPRSPAQRITYALVEAWHNVFGGYPPTTAHSLFARLHREVFTVLAVDQPTDRSLPRHIQQAIKDATEVAGRHS